MTTGEKIYKLRRDKGWSQEELAEKLNVSRQTVYKWEADIAKPENDNLKQLVSLLDTSYNFLLDDSITNNTNDTPSVPAQQAEQTVQPKPQPEPTVKPQKPLTKIGTCDKCGKTIYDNEYMHTFDERIGRTNHHHVYCNNCFIKRQEEIKAREAFNKSERIRKQKRNRVLSYVFGGLLFVGLLLTGIFTKDDNGNSLWVYGLISGILGFTLVSTLLLNNNRISDIVLEIWSWGCFRMPGVIFSLSPDGIMFLILVKVGGAILSFLLGILALMAGLVVGGVCSLFAYPFAIVRSYKKPELYGEY